jgi:ABC-type nitrate/sulfonate/bicarbonate transport system substrate-binding protein
MSKLMAVVAMLAAVALAGTARAADKIVLQLHGPAQFEFAGYYAALWQGFYRDAGLAVEIKPGAGRDDPPIDPAREVIEGRAQFGTGSMDLVMRIAQGQPLLLLAPIFQQSGAGVYYREGGDFASPAALAKGKVGRLPASDILDIELATALRAEGVDPAQLKPVPLQSGGIVGALADRSVDAAPGSAWEVAWRAHEKGFAVKSFNPADYRVEFYGDTLFTVQRLAKTDPATVRAFRAASLKGWEYALTHADDVAARMLAELPHPPGVADAGGYTRYQTELAPLLARYPNVRLGHSNPDRWRRIEASMLGIGALVRTADPADFVYDADAELRGRTDFRAFAILGATLVAGIAMMAFLWRSRRRPAAANASAANASDSGATDAGAALPGAVASAALPPGPSPEPAAPLPVPPPREPGAADLNTVLTRIERAMRRGLPRGVSFRLSLLPGLWRCRADPLAVRMLVLDLTEAAVADMRSGGELVVGTRNYAFDAAALAGTPGAQLGEYVRVTVRDSGPGLSDAALGRVLDPGLTARPSAAAAAEALRPLGGFVRVESAQGIGTAVHLYFPRAADATDASAAEARPAKAAE